MPGWNKIITLSALPEFEFLDLGQEGILNHKVQNQFRILWFWREHTDIARQKIVFPCLPITILRVRRLAWKSEAISLIQNSFENHRTVVTTSENSRLANIQFAFRPPSTQDSLDRLCKAIPNSQCGSLQIFCEFVHPNANGQSRKILSGIGPATKLDDYNLVIFRGISNLVKSQILFEQFGPASEMGSAREPNKSAQPLARIIWSPTASMRHSKGKNIFIMGHLYELAETHKNNPCRAT